VDVVRSGRAALEVERHERRPGARGGVAPRRQAGVEGGAPGLWRVLNMCHEVLLDRVGVEITRRQRAEAPQASLPIVDSSAEYRRWPLEPARRRFGALAAG
jgi:hypothetical protein